MTTFRFILATTLLAVLVLVALNAIAALHNAL